MKILIIICGATVGGVVFFSYLARAQSIKYFQTCWNDPKFDNNKPFTVTEKHVALLRTLRFSWGSAETGAPEVDQNRPYGSKDIFKELKRIAGSDNKDELATLHLDSYRTLHVLLRHGKLTPGRYRIKHLSTTEIKKMFKGLKSVEENPNGLPLGLSEDGWFEVLPEHLKLLKTMVLGWTRSYNVYGRYPAPEIDPKRTYSPGYGPYNPHVGVEILNWPLTKDAAGEYVYTQEQADRIFQLHWSMLPAIQVFVENASLELKTYE